MEQTQIIENSTGRILFTLSTAPDEATYYLEDGSGLRRSVSVYHVCDNSICAVKVWPKTVESFAYKK